MNALPYVSKRFKIIGAVAVTVLILIRVLFASMETVPAGHVGVGSVFGEVQPDFYSEGVKSCKPSFRYDVI